MTARTLFAALLGVAVGTTAVTVGPLHSAPAPEAKPPRWEYKVVQFSNATIADRLTKEVNTLAEDGWEYAGPIVGDSHAYSIAFRRSK
jgi:hypothetical protein